MGAEGATGRRQVVRLGLGAAAWLWARGASAALSPLPVAAPGGPSDSVTLAGRFSDLKRRIVFEYYPWYARSPVRHWEQWGRRPPLDLASHYVPLLGAYDSRDWRVIERHARWIADSGVGSINLSWWGQGSFEDRLVPRVMDVMADHGIRVCFHLEPYHPRRAERLADDVRYLLVRYGARRHHDTLLLLPGQNGPAPVFKGFATIVPARETDCHGVTEAVEGYVPDDLWRRQIESVREEWRREFPGIIFLADSIDVVRARSAGFDGLATYDNFIGPERYGEVARRASAHGLVYSGNVNAGFDGIVPRHLPPRACRRTVPFEPSANLDWSTETGRERAVALSSARIRTSLAATVAAQTDPSLLAARTGFFLIYVNSFNEWHEGTAFEPMCPADALTPAQQALGYHNPLRGDVRLAVLSEALRALGARCGDGDTALGCPPVSAVP